MSRARIRRLSGVLALALLVGSTSGCETIAALMNRGALETDLLTILKKRGIEPRPVDCEMLGATRTGWCLVDLNIAEFHKVKRSLELMTPPRVGASNRSVLETIEAEERGGCQDHPSFRPGPMRRAVGIWDRPASLRLSTGRSLEYLMLYRSGDEASALTCIQASYAIE